MSNHVSSSIPRENRATPILHGAILATFMGASSVPTPLYHLYQETWRFSSTTLTMIFAVYAFGLLAALLIGGKISDHIGRRPTICAALIGELAAIIIFHQSSNADWLIAARFVQGLATGIATSSIGAALLDVNKGRGALINSITPLGGMAIGTILCSLLVVFAPYPMHLIYELLFVIVIIEILLIWITPETADVHSGALKSLKPSVLVPPQARSMLIAISPLNISTWGLGGFYLSLMPSIVIKATGSSSVLLGGLIVSLLTISGAVSIAYFRNHAPHHILYRGAFLVCLGVMLIIVGTNLHIIWLMLAGSTIAGLGFGSCFLGILRSLMPLAEPRQRAGLMAAYYLESYLAFSLPAIGAGILAQHIGLIPTVTIYGTAIIALVIIAVITLRITTRRHITQEPA
ncbi:MFS transporter [Marinomonas polaris]|uniref:MFS transporter n=1 Tax=Marinomonas polaris TaxID=293552 RepID=UPI003F97B7B9